MQVPSHAAASIAVSPVLLRAAAPDDRADVDLVCDRSTQDGRLLDRNAHYVPDAHFSPGALAFRHVPDVPVVRHARDGLGAPVLPDVHFARDGSDVPGPQG